MDICKSRGFFQFLITFGLFPFFFFLFGFFLINNSSNLTDSEMNDWYPMNPHIDDTDLRVKKQLDERLWRDRNKITERQLY